MNIDSGAILMFTRPGFSLIFAFPEMRLMENRVPQILWNAILGYFLILDNQPR